MKMNIILFSRKELKHRPEQLRTIIESITRYGLEYSINEDFANVIESLTGISIDSKNRYKNFPKATGNDLLITYGGDGTLLDAVELRPSAETPIVGINCGRLGYLTADDGQGIKELFDAIAERRVFECFEELSAGRLTVFVSHRLSSAVTASKIVVIDGGKIAEVGTHTELMAKGEKYYTLFTTQADRYMEK